MKPAGREVPWQLVVINAGRTSWGRLNHSSSCSRSGCILRQLSSAIHDRCSSSPLSSPSLLLLLLPPSSTHYVSTDDDDDEVVVHHHMKCPMHAPGRNPPEIQFLISALYIQQQQQQPFNGHLSVSGTTRVGQYQKKHSPAHTHPGQRTSFITFLHLQRSTASSLFSLHAWQSSRTTSFLNFILHAFLHTIIIIFSQHLPIPTQPVLLQYQCYVIYS